MAFPHKKYERLRNLQKLWQVSHDDIYYAAENGILKTAIWLPLRYVERRVIADRKFIYETCEHLEGFVGVRPEDTRKIFSHGRAKLRIFNSFAKEGHILRLAYEPPQPSISVRIDDLVVLEEHKLQFEETYDITEADVPKQKQKEKCQLESFRASEDYRHILFKGKEYHMGEFQGKIIEMLHDAAMSRNPWVHGKTLIYESGSSASRMRDIFKSKPEWKKLITSNERGLYRLNVPLQYEHDHVISKNA